MKTVSFKMCWLLFSPALLAALLLGSAGRADDRDSSSERWKREQEEESRRRSDRWYNEWYERTYGHPPVYLPPLDGQNLFAVITYSPATKKAGTSKGWISLGSAQRAAMIAGRAPDARPVVWVKNGYCALAVGKDGSYASGYAATLERAKELALQECGKRTSDCEIAAWVFSGRKRANAAVAGGGGGTGMPGGFPTRQPRR